MTLLRFEVAYSWQSCDRRGQHCRAGTDTTATPFAARSYVPGQAEAGRRLRVTETAAEVIRTERLPFTFQVIRRAVSVLAPSRVRAYPAGRLPSTAFVDGLPERHTVSTSEYFQVAAPHASPADGPVTQSGYVCSPGKDCKGPHSFVAYCRAVYAVPHGFAAVKLDVGLDGQMFYPCP